MWKDEESPFKPSARAFEENFPVRNVRVDLLPPFAGDAQSFPGWVTQLEVGIHATVGNNKDCTGPNFIDTFEQVCFSSMVYPS